MNSASDTKKLLRECEAGIKMGIASLDDVMAKANDFALEQTIGNSRQEHIALRTDAQVQLSQLADKGKNPNPAAKLMSHMKTKMVTEFDSSDGAVARLVTKGCDMGITSLNRYMEKYAAADSESRSLVCRVIAAEERLINDMKGYI